MDYPRIAYSDDKGGLRVVVTQEGSIVEVAAGVDAMGCVVWRRVSTEDPAMLRVTKIEGWKDLCAATGLDPSQWRRLLSAAQRHEYPFPLKYDAFDTPFAYQAAVEAWVDINERSVRARRAERELQKVRERRGRRSAA